jgi:hypothetical protein
MTIWQIKSPKDCPVPKSETYAGIAFTGRYETYTHADTWYPSWASDGHLYSPYTDGEVTENEPVISAETPPQSASLIGVSQERREDSIVVLEETDYEESDFGGDIAETGQARIVGDDPLNLEIQDFDATAEAAAPYGGRYPCGSLVHDNIWYYGTYCLAEERYNWDILGPFVGFRVSEDGGETWTKTPHSPRDPLFGESPSDESPVKIGAPKFVDFGQNMEHSPDRKAYLVAHGGSKSDANVSWISGDQIYLLRVEPDIDTINDPDAYEFLAGNEDGDPVWSQDFGALTPLFEWEDNCGCVTATYIPGLDVYVMCITNGWPPEGTMDTYLLVADELTGPWELLHYMEDFGEQAYFVNIPSKFLSGDGRVGYLCYANNFTGDQRVDPPGGEYGMCLQEFQILS